MAEATKLITVLGGLFKAEATYGAGGSVAAGTDGIALAYDDFEGAPMEYTEDYDGSGAKFPGIAAARRRFPPSGRVVTGELPFYGLGAGTAYTTSVLPNIHALMLAAGFDAAIDVTASSENVLYTPTPGFTGFGSIFGELYARGEMWPYTHGLCDLSVQIDGAGPPKWMFDVIALLGDPTDASVPTVTYSAVVAAKAEQMVTNIGTYVPVLVKSATFALGRSKDNARLALGSAGAHAGFSPEGRNPTLTMVIESTALQTTPFHNTNGIDPYQLKKLMSEIAVDITVGSVQYNQYTISLPQAQLVNVTPQSEGPVATWELVFEGHSSDGASDDDVSILFD